MASLVINVFAKSYTSVTLVSVSVSIQPNAIICLKSLNHRPCAHHLVVTIQTFTPLCYKAANCLCVLQVK